MFSREFDVADDWIYSLWREVFGSTNFDKDFREGKGRIEDRVKKVFIAYKKRIESGEEDVC